MSERESISAAIAPGRMTLPVIARLLFLALLIGLGTKALVDQNLQVLSDTGPDGWGTTVTPDASTDAYLRALLRERDREVMAGIPHPAEKLRSAFASLPGDGAILFTGDRQDVSFLLVLLTTAQLSQPRPVYELRCETQTVDNELPLNTRVAAVIYYLTQPPAGRQGQTILPGLTLVPVTQSGQLKHFCSR
ncbi:MAG TPA: hypothetical protein VNQ79_01640 [Blastocatellia bacterium]|nr:hypothetical protein [Blastocatellia bacterium]